MIASYAQFVLVSNITILLFVGLFPFLVRLIDRQKSSPLYLSFRYYGVSMLCWSVCLFLLFFMHRYEASPSYALVTALCFLFLCTGFMGLSFYQLWYLPSKDSQEGSSKKWVQTMVFVFMFLCVMILFLPITGIIYPVVYGGCGILVTTYLFYSFVKYILVFVGLQPQIKGSLVDHTIHQIDSQQRDAGLSLYHEAVIAQRLETWISEERYIEELVNIERVASEIGTNRTYLSTYLNTRVGMTFRNWIGALRLDYSLELMKAEPTLPIIQVAERINYTPSGFRSIFMKHYGISLADWRKKQFHGDDSN